MSKEVQVIAQLESALEHTEQGMILFAGDWGAGKSFFMQQHFLPYLEKQNRPAKIISAFGITNTADFKNRIIAKCYSDNNKTLDALISLGDKFSKSQIKTLQKSGFLLQLLTPVLTEIAEKALGEIVLIIDDLERVKDEKIRESIIAECYHLSLESKLNIIIVANKNVIRLDRSIFEKGFSDIIEFKRDTDTLINIAFEQTLTPMQNGFLHRYIHDHSVFNIRFLKRIARKYQAVKPAIAARFGDAENPYEYYQLLVSIAAILDLLYLCAVPRAKISATLSLIHPGRHEEIDLLALQQISENITQDDLLRIKNTLKTADFFTWNFTPSVLMSLIHFCAGVDAQPAENIVNFIPHNNKINQLLNVEYWTENTDFDALMQEINKLHTQLNQPNINDATLLIENLHQLIKLSHLNLYDQKNLDKDIKLFRKKITEKKISLSQSEFNRYFDSEQFPELRELAELITIQADQLSPEKQIKLSLEKVYKQFAENTPLRTPFEDEVFITLIREHHACWKGVENWQSLYRLATHIVSEKSAINLLRLIADIQQSFSQSSPAIPIRITLEKLHAEIIRRQQCLTPAP